MYAGMFYSHKFKGSGVYGEDSTLSGKKNYFKNYAVIFATKYYFYSTLRPPAPVPMLSRR